MSTRYMQAFVFVCGWHWERGRERKRFYIKLAESEIFAPDFLLSVFNIERLNVVSINQMSIYIFVDLPSNLWPFINVEFLFSPFPTRNKPLHEHARFVEFYGWNLIPLTVVSNKKGCRRHKRKSAAIFVLELWDRYGLLCVVRRLNWLFCAIANASTPMCDTPIGIAIRYIAV
jgi:hypothetical protein